MTIVLWYRGTPSFCCTILEQLMCFVIKKRICDSKNAWFKIDTILNLSDGHRKPSPRCLKIVIYPGNVDRRFTCGNWTFFFKKKGDYVLPGRLSDAHCVKVIPDIKMWAVMYVRLQRPHKLAVCVSSGLSVDGRSQRRDRGLRQVMDAIEFVQLQSISSYCCHSLHSRGVSEIMEKRVI